MTPKEASKARSLGQVYFNSLDRKQINEKSKPKYKPGDQVRISKYKRHFEKGYPPNWTEEIFVVDKVNETNPLTYQLKDLKDEKVLGSFYQQEMASAKQKIFRIEQVIKRDNKTKGPS